MQNTTKIPLFNRSLNVKNLSKLFHNDRLSLEMLEQLGFKRQNNRLILQYQVLDSSTITKNTAVSDHDQQTNIKSNSDSFDDVAVVTKSQTVQTNPEVVAIEFKKRIDESIKSNNAFQLDQWIEKQQIQVCKKLL